MDVDDRSMDNMMQAMMMHMDKLPDFSDHHHHHHQPLFPPSSSFFNNSNNPQSSILLQPHHHNNNNVTNNINDSSSTFAYLSSEKKQSSMATMREMIFRIAVMQPIQIDPDSIKPPRRRNVRISKDPQSVAARHRRERISERIRILQRLVPGGTKMDTASMLDEAIHYVKFLKNQVHSLQQLSTTSSNNNIYMHSSFASSNNHY